MSLSVGCSSGDDGGDGDEGDGTNNPMGSDDYVVLSGDGAQAAPSAAPSAFTQCSVCHGAQAQGTANNLGPEIRHITEGYATHIVRNGRPGTAMSAYNETNLSSTDLTAILAWLNSFPKATSGEQLYLDYCGNCHGVDGLGHPTGVALVGEELSEIRSNVRSGHAADFGERTEYMPAFDATRITDAEIDLIGQFLQAR